MVYLRTCGDMKIIPANYILKNLPTDRLVLKHHILGPRGTKALAVALVENSTVQVLDLEDNGIGLRGATYLAEMLEENNFITELRLADNLLGGEGVKAILDVIKDPDFIRVLDFSGADLQESDGHLFTQIIEDSHNLKELYLNHNSFREVGGELIGDAIGWNDTLEVLDLSWNHLRLKGAVSIAQGLAINDGIKVLNLSWNGFHLSGCKELAKALEKNSTLEELDISANRISKICLTELIKGLAKNETLRVLKLSHNPITSSGALYILNNIKDVTTSALQEIDLGDQCVEPEFVRVYEELKETRNLTITHGSVLGQDGTAEDDEEELINENPVIVLMEFGKLMGLRLIDLFSMMDKDNSKTLTREEIKQGLLEANIPLTEKCLNKLVHKLDTDGDGEIDYGELMAGKEIHRRKLTQTIMQSRDQQLLMEETEFGRVRQRLLNLTAKHRRGGMRSGFSTIAGLKNIGGKIVETLPTPPKASERRKSVSAKLLTQLEI
ncbi:leucine-rich repeat-containing protein 74B [Patella vulgata]|uniref:leucine-rich repeat-containing protein 74B n=1 Tax=Patella vulgata TaxID=6465 RepID=UPI00217FC7A9|nr:leucine-rich repeat-containing protein 74B [Patella vulgata]